MPHRWTAPNYRLWKGGWLKYEAPSIEVPQALVPFSERWWGDLQEELAPLAGKTPDPRFIQVILVKL